MIAFVEAEEPAGRNHAVMEFFRLTRVWLAAFWGGALLALAGTTLTGLWLWRARSER